MPSFGAPGGHTPPSIFGITSDRCRLVNLDGLFLIGTRRLNPFAPDKLLVSPHVLDHACLEFTRRMIIDPQIEQYMNNLLPPRDEVLAEIEAYAAEHKIPIVGPAVGRFLAALVMMTGAKRIFELGSAIGYSTIWLARAAGPDSEIHYSDGSPENAQRARASFERAGVASRIHIHVGDALTALASTSGAFDVIFNDVDKDGYPAVLDAVPDRIRTGGLFITDNTLWHGRVLNPQEATGRAVCLFNQRLFASPQFYTTQLPIRDGVSVAIRQ